MKEYNKIDLNFEWIKGFKLKMQSTRFINFCIGVLLLSISAALLVHVIAPNGFIH